MQYRLGIHKCIHYHSIRTPYQILSQQKLVLTFKKNIIIKRLLSHPLPLFRAKITVQSLPPPFIGLNRYMNKIWQENNWLLFFTILFWTILHMKFLISLVLNILYLLAHLDPTFHDNPSSRTVPKDLQQTHYDWGDNQQKTLRKYAINQLTQYESELQAITTTNLIVIFCTKARAATLVVWKLTGKFSEKKVHGWQVSCVNKKTWSRGMLPKFFECILNHNPENRRNELKCLNLVKNREKTNNS